MALVRASAITRYTPKRTRGCPSLGLTLCCLFACGLLFFFFYCCAVCEAGGGRLGCLGCPLSGSGWKTAFVKYINLKKVI